MNRPEGDEFDRIRRNASIEKSRLLIAQYEAGLAFFHAEIEQDMFQLGKLDERLTR